MLESGGTGRLCPLTTLFVADSKWKSTAKELNKASYGYIFKGARVRISGISGIERRLSHSQGSIVSHLMLP
jgi:hypothetical protein